ncbi:hypothetical protein SLS62_001437 [Diatrype stigma]|uniref:Uncharacterized protein n=1 Tax=Diatrype stigma TaxID=117547 RepID=A0AAN9UW81_9PEZI
MEIADPFMMLGSYGASSAPAAKANKAANEAMPSLGAFKKSALKAGVKEVFGGGPSKDIDTDDDGSSIRGSGSKRQFLRNLVQRNPSTSRGSGSEEEQGGGRRHRRYASAATALTGRRATNRASMAGVAGMQASSSSCPNTSSSEAPSSPGNSIRLNPYRDKPLPSPPPPGTIDKADGPQPRPPVLRLARIMASLSDAEIESLFSGAPQFFARSQGQGTGAPHPSVAFPWDDELAIRDLTDHTQIENDAWGCVTASPRIILRDPMSAISPVGRKRPHFNTKCQERPNMLSMQGSEKGTLGYQAALELSVADTLLEEQYGFDSLGSKGQVIVERRQWLITSKDGLRHLDDASVMEQLLKLEQRYHGERDVLRMKSRDLYNELFLKVLHPPTRVIDQNDPYSLAVQIHALVKILATHNAWIDFSRVEWRIRLGQILWGFPLDDELEDGSAINDGNDAEDRGEERYWLLLQILLACELLIRLDAITEGEEYGAQRLRAHEVHKFEKEANPSVKWSLLLARAWLDNITIVKTPVAQEEPTTPRSWLNSLTTKMHLKHESMHGAHHTDHTQHRHNAQSEYVYSIKGKYNERQVFGLTQFARKLRWPDIEAYVFKVNEQASSLTKPTPINTPLQACDCRRTSYFNNYRPRNSVDSSLQEGRRRKLGAALHPSGWLSKAYFSGLLLPGEALSHYLMSSLLETDVEAMVRLGPLANLGGGFMYRGKSFWSTACIVGRVLAAGRGAVECMGWISSDVLPQGRDEGWVDIEVNNIADDLAKTGRKARLWGKTIIERESDVLGDGEPSNVLPADFILPHESQYSESPPSNIRVELKSLDLSAPMDDARSMPPLEKYPSADTNKPPEIRTYPASMAFAMTHDDIDEQREFEFNLRNDVYFVTAHPCAPSNRVKFFKSPTSPTIQQIDVVESEFGGSSAHILGHPLHKYYTYATIHLVDLLDRPDDTLEEILHKGHRTGRTASTLSPSAPLRPPRTLVIDCVTGFAPPRSPDMPALSRVSSLSSSFAIEPTSAQFPMSAGSSPDMQRRPSTAASSGSKIERIERIDPPMSKYNTQFGNGNNGGGGGGGYNVDSPEAKMHLGTRKRRFGSDMEIMARALCAERGWNALISRRRRGCLACAIREAGALGWRVIIRVE